MRTTLTKAPFCRDTSESRLWHPSGKAFAAIPALTGQEKTFHEPPVASPGFWKVWACLARCSCYGWYHCSCFEGSKRNPDLVGNAAIQCPWHFCLVDTPYEPCFCFENESIGKKKMPVLLFSGASLTSILLWITGSKIWPNLNYCYWERLEKYKYWAGEWAQWIREKNAIQTKRREKLLCGDGKRTGEGKRKLKLNGKMQYIGHPFKPVYILVVRSVP